MIKRYSGLMLLILFPVIGFMGMVLILAGGREEQNSPDSARPSSRNYPTPLPILTTPVPTTAPVPVIDVAVPAATLVTLQGETFEVADFKDNVVILNFWATWCPPCVEEMPLLREYAAAHENVRVLAITTLDSAQSVEVIQAFIDEYDLQGLTIGLDENGYLQGTMQAIQLPTTFIVDEAGIVRFRHIGPVDTEALDFYLEQMN